MKKLLAFAVCCSVCQSYAFAPVYEGGAISDDVGQAIAEQSLALENASSSDDEVLVVAERESPSQSRAAVSEGSEDSTPFQLLSQKLQLLQDRVASLQGQLETQAHQLDELRAQRITQAPTTQAMGVAATASAMQTQADQVRGGIVQSAKVASQPGGATGVRSGIDSERSGGMVHSSSSIVTSVRSQSMNEQLTYMAAFELVKARKYNQAMVKLEAFLKQYPDGPYAANAYYWLGEIHYAQNRYQAALVAFNTVTREFTDSSKVAAALFKTGMTYERLGRGDKAQLTFKQVVEQHPGTSVARLATLKLN